MSIVDESQRWRPEPPEVPRTTTFKTTLRTKDFGSDSDVPAFRWLAVHRARKYGCPEDVEPTVRQTIYGIEYTFEWPS